MTFLIFFAGVWGCITSALLFYCMGQRVRILLLKEKIDAMSIALARPAIAVFQESQMEALKSYLWQPIDKTKVN